MTQNNLILQNNIAPGIVELVINRAEALNALNSEVLNALSEAFKNLIKEKVVIIKGGGEKGFAAGADIKEMSEIQNSAEFVSLGQKVMSEIEQAPAVTIASIRGFALGGGFELALACDLIVAEKKAKIGLPEVSLGLIPGFGGTQRLTLRAGIGLTRLMTLTGEPILAEELYAKGVIDLICESDELNQTTKKLAEKIALKSTDALSSAKKSISFLYAELKNRGLKNEEGEFNKLFVKQSAKDGIMAFLNRAKK